MIYNGRGGREGTGEGGVMQGGYYSKADPSPPTPLPSGYNAAGVLPEPAVSQLLW